MPQFMQQFYSSADYSLALPMLLLTLFGSGILLIDLMLPEEWKSANAWTALVGLGFAGFAVYRIQAAYGAVEAGGVGGLDFTGFGGALIVDRFAIYFFYLFLLAAAISIAMSVRYLEVEQAHHGEFYAMILFSVVGMMAMASGFDIVLLFIGLELMAISTYILVGFLRRDRRSNEAALKYMLLGAFSSGIFAYGLSLFYGLTGSTNVGEITFGLAQHVSQNPKDPVVVLAMITTAAGLFFKVAAVPFHQWAPDAYEGAPTTITGFMSVAVKAASWALLLRIFLYAMDPLRPLYLPLVIFVAIATMTGGNLGALGQTNLKRLLAYSSIAHVGYMLLGLVAGNATETSATGIKGILVYLLVYTFMNLGAFAVITSLRRRDIIGDELADINGLYFKAPYSAVLMLAFLLSLTGIPPMAGFYGKYFIFLALIETGSAEHPLNFYLAGLAVIYVAISLYYYLRIANAMFMGEAADAEPVRLAPGVGVALAVTGAATIGIGIFPEMFLRAADWSLRLGTSATTAGLLR